MHKGILTTDNIIERIHQSFSSHVKLLLMSNQILQHFMNDILQLTQIPKITYKNNQKLYKTFARLSFTIIHNKESSKSCQSHGLHD